MQFEGVRVCEEEAGGVAVVVAVEVVARDGVVAVVEWRYLHVEERKVLFSCEV